MLSSKRRRNNFLLFPLNLPSEEQALEYFDKYHVPESIRAHCLAVQGIAVFLAKKVQETGRIINVELVSLGSLLHDLFKMAAIKDVSPNEFHNKVFSEEELAMREHLRTTYPGMYENQIAYEIFKQEFPELATTLLNEGNPRLRERTIEESIIHYADYRIFKEQVVALQARFDYFRKRYQAPDGFWDDYYEYCLQEEAKIFKDLAFKPEDLRELMKNG
jgi:hypothetical protein